MSSTGIENRPPLSESSHDSLKKVGKSDPAAKTGSTKTAGRRTLKTLQPSGKNQMLLVGSDGLVRLGGGSGKKEIKIYHDSPPPLTSTPERAEPVSRLVQATVETKCSSTQFENEDTAQARAEEQMYGAEEDLPLEYWKDLAEKRREALEVSLTENESLHTSLSLIEEERDRLKEEKDTYKSLAEQAQELATMLKGIVSDEEEEEQSGGEEEDSHEAGAGTSGSGAVTQESETGTVTSETN